MSFSERDYTLVRDGCQRSAATVVPIIMELVKPYTVADVGCGDGWWLREFQAHGCDVWGVDRAAQHNLPFPYRRVDLEDLGFLDVRPADLVVCLEVAAHLPAARADGLIRSLAASSPNVLFSAAIPGQGDVGHLNEQYPRYWAQKFEDRGYRVTGALRWQIWDLAPHHVESWYAQNLLLAMRDPGQLAYLFEGPASYPIAAIHPVLWDSRR